MTTSLYKLYHYSSLIQGERLPALLRFMLRNIPINTTACTAGHSSQAELQTLPNWDRDNHDCPTEVSRPNEVSRIVLYNQWGPFVCRINSERHGCWNTYNQLTIGKSFDIFERFSKEITSPR